MVGDDVDPLPASVEQLKDAGGDAIDLLVEVVDKSAPELVAAVIDFARLGPRRAPMDPLTLFVGPERPC